jgi:hypothetical protein
LSRALALVLALTWHGAALPQQAFAVTPARTEAAGYALTHGIVVANLVGNCAKFRERLPQDPAAALAAWRERNAERASAAESYLVYAHAAIARRSGEAAAEAFNRQTRGLFRRKANATLNDIFEGTAPQLDVCARWVEAIAGGKADLNWESKYINALDELVAFERSVRSGGTTR